MSYSPGLQTGVRFGLSGHSLSPTQGSMTGGSTGGLQGSTSSKAVLAALRTLQDKIRRLEIERTEALHETNELRAQLQNQELDHEALKQRDTVSAQKNLTEARAAYDRLVAEKTELEIKLGRLAERNKEAQSTSEELATKIRQLEEDKHVGALKTKELEAHHRHLESQIQQVQQKEKDLAQTIAWETKRHEDEMSSINATLHSLQDELTRACQEKHAQDSKLLELDQLVAQLLAVNEALVAQLTGRSGLRSSSSPRSSSPRAAHHHSGALSPTSTPAYSSAAPSSSSSGGGGWRRREGGGGHASSANANNGRSQHTVVVPRAAYEKTEAFRVSERKKYIDESAARRLGNKSSSSSSSSSAHASAHASGSSSSSSSSSGAHRLAGRARVLQQAHELYRGIVQEALQDQRDLDLEEDEEEGEQEQEQEQGWGGSRPAPTREQVKSHLLSGHTLPSPPKSVQDLVRKASELNREVAALQSGHSSSSSSSSSTRPPAPPLLPSAAAARARTQAYEEYYQRNASAPETGLSSELAALEEEFRSLDREYQSILGGTRDGAGAGAGAGGLGAAQSEELTRVLGRLHSTHRRLHELKSPPKAQQQR